MKPIICFGEIMLRLSPPDFLRLAQALPGQLDAAFAGAEVNAAVTIAQLGGPARFVTALPANQIGDAAVAIVRAAGVDVTAVVRPAAGRCGTYFVETGASQRGGLVVYDREGSVFATTGFDGYRWTDALAGGGWFHTTGISAGVSRIGAETTAGAVQAARGAGLTLSCDLNFRRKLWGWDPGVSPQECYRRTLAGIVDQIDLLIGNSHDIAALIGETFHDAEGSPLTPHIALAQRVAKRFGRLRWIAITLRQIQSASCHRWGALLYRVADGAVFAAPGEGGYEPYVIDTIVDRVGTGDAFAGALIFALQTDALADPAKAIAFATAAGCLAHSIKGDFFYCTRAEVEALMTDGTGGHVSR